MNSGVAAAWGLSPGAANDVTAPIVNGTYTLRLPDGQYWIWFKEGDFTTEFYDDTQSPFSARVLTISGGTALTDVNASVERLAVISGRVLDEDGQPIASTEVSLHRVLAAGSEVWGATTDQDGFYQALVQPADYQVRFTGKVMNDEYGPMPTYRSEWYDDVADRADAEVLSAVAGTPNEDIDAVLGELGANLVGTVIGPVGSLAGADVSVYDTDGNLLDTMRTDDDNVFAFSIPSQCVTLVAIDPKGFYALGLTELCLQDGYVEPVQLRLNAGGRITGSVTSEALGTPLGGALVSVRRIDDPWPIDYVVTTDADGAYVTPKLPSGSYRVEFTDAAGQHLSEYYENAMSSDAATLVDVMWGNTTVDAALQLPGTRLSVRTVDEDGVALPDIEVMLLDNALVQRELGSTAADGRVTFDVEPICGVVMAVDRTGIYGLEFTQLCLQQDYHEAVEFEMRPGGTITGVVTSDTDGSPITGASVEVQRIDAGFAWAAPYPVLVEADGTYTSPGLPPGTYRVFFRDPSGEHHGEFYDDAANPVDSAPVIVGPGAMVTADASLAAAIRPNLVGQVLGPTDQPLAGIRLQIVDDSWVELASVTTGPDGRFDLMLPAMCVTIVVTDPNGSYAFRQLPMCLQSGYVEPIEIALAPGGTFTGQVTSLNGAPLAGVQVWATRSLPGGLWEAVPGNLVTDALGRYTTIGLPPGQYLVSFGATDDDYLDEWFDDAPSPDVADRVAVSAGSVTTGIDARLTRLGSINGTVTYASTGGGPAVPAPGITVTVHPTDGSAPLTGSTGADGTYSIDVPDGDYVVEFAGTAVETLWYGGATDLLSAQTLSVVNRDVLTDIDASLRRLGTLTGVVTDHAGAPIADVEVLVEATDGSTTALATTGADGTYTVGVVPGNHTIRFGDPLERYAPEWYDNRTRRSLAGAVSVAGGATVTGINATLASGYLYRAWVFDGGTGDSLLQFTVDVYTSAGTPLYDDLPSEGGLFRLVLPPGNYALEFAAPGGYLSRTVSLQIVDEPVDSDVSLEKAVVVSGKVFDGTLGGPLAGAEVTATSLGIAGAPAATYPSREAASTTLTDANGDYSFRMVPGRYGIIVRKAGYAELHLDDASWWWPSPTSYLDVVAGATQTVPELRPRQAATVSGVVTDARTGLPIAGEVVEIYRGAMRGRETRTTDASGRYSFTGLPPGGDVTVFSTSSTYASNPWISPSVDDGTDVVDAHLALRPFGFRLTAEVRSRTTGLVVADACGQVFAVQFDTTSALGPEVCAALNDGGVEVDSPVTTEVYVRFRDPAALLEDLWVPFTAAPGTEDQPGQFLLLDDRVLPPGAPASLTASPGIGQVALSWTAPTSDGGSPVTGYRVRWRLAGTTSWTTLPDRPSSPRAHTVSGLVSGATYEFEVYAINAIGVSSSAASASATVLSVPGAPTSLLAAPGVGQVMLTWTPPTFDGGTPVTNYRIRWRLVGAPSWSAPLTRGAAPQAVTVSGLVSGATYEFEVHAINAIGVGSSAASVSSTVWSVPGAPASVSAVPGVGQAVVTWDAPSSEGGTPATGYRVRWRFGTSGSWTTLPDRSVSPRSLTVSGLRNGASHQFQVFAINAVGVGTIAATTVVTTPSVPEQPTNLVAVPGDEQVDLSWSAPDDDGGSPITDYVVRMSTSGGSWVTLDDGTSTSTTFTATGLRNGTSYRFVVLARNAVGTGSTSASVIGIPVRPPDPPASITATPGVGRVSLAWASPRSNGGSAITGFRLRWRVTGTETWTNLPDRSSTPRSFTVTGLASGTSYDFEVYSFNAIGVSTTAAAATATTPTVPDAPTGLTATPGDRLVNLAWVAPTVTGGSTVTGYSIRWRVIGTTTWSTPVNRSASPRSYTVTGLLSGSSYEIEVYAVNAVGASALPATTTATVPTVPDAPTGLTATPGNRQVSLSWSVPADGGAAIVDYQVWMRAGSTGSWSRADGATPSTTTTFTATGLRNGVSYSFIVYAVNSAGRGPASATRAATPYDPRPVARDTLMGSCKAVVKDGMLSALTTDPDGPGDIVRWELVSVGFSATTYAWSFNETTGYYRITIPASTADGTRLLFRWRAIDAEGNLSNTATFTFRATSDPRLCRP